ncbi:cofactor-independent phosphoglycerate mutase [Trichlorobacter ammonificans]|uniref:2,3-bisphosphoglycerate-independent phosphoglycerate mutase n=1 Tax=Trichlorobacter ammonificans TaxID=2916410 RepID=A0ABN8HFD7_9BACT|nr:cofactor-independent phosphoglycerate mutase [Trichlorobacter ammonificans]CAH2031569.1 putative 2,3-bisphosphoglycerate-independent phosphoglycerate mutase [Trichlorobacter ammonificans]
MKILILLGDGMSDLPIAELGNKTPLQAAQTPHMDRMAANGLMGLAHTVPAGLPPGSDVANLSVFGYDPRTCYTGRSPLEALSMGISLGPDDVAFRMNMVTLDPRGGKVYMEDFSAGHIGSDESHQLVAALQQELGNERFQFFPGVGYRHLMVWRGGKDTMKAVPPHDISGKPILGHLPTGDGADELIWLMNAAQMVLHTHPVNRARKERGELPANAVWLWGHGKTPQLTSYREKFGLSGAVISAVDLIKGIGVCAGLQVINVPGATGYIDTNYKGKAEAALSALEKHDFVYVHVEAPDEASHNGDLQHKIQAIEDFDRLVVGTVLEQAGRFDDLRILCCPDHPTPIALKTHTSDPVPFVIHRPSGSTGNGATGYDEIQARGTGLVVAEGHHLMEMLLADT